MLATDKFYFIMDCNGNYYRTDSKNQLVIVKDETEADVFSFADANKRIGTGVKSHFYFMVPVPMKEIGGEFMQETEETNIDEVQGISGDIAEVIISTVNEVIKENVKETKVSMVKELVEGEVAEFVEKTISEYDLSASDWKEYLLHFTYIVAIQNYLREELYKCLTREES